MFKLVALAALVAVASAGQLAYSGLPLAAPWAHNIAAPYAAAPWAHNFATPYAAGHLAYAAAPAIAAHAPIAYAAAPAVAAVPAPVTYTTGNKVLTHVEPVEQHGYKIVY